MVNTSGLCDRMCWIWLEVDIFDRVDYFGIDGLDLVDGEDS